MSTPKVAFHFNANDKIGYGARLVRKGYLRGARMVVWGDPRDLDRFSHVLWTQAPGDFVGHARAEDPQHVQRHSRVHLSPDLPEDVSPDTMLVNLTDEYPGDLVARYGRVFEIVTADTADRQRARQRWMSYRHSGVEPDRHDLGAHPG